jgi:tryptophan-rich sensory protein
MKISSIFKLILIIAACELAGIIGAAFTAPEISSWYAGLVKPALSPPNWVFGPVWITLYALMGVSFFFVWKNYSDISGDSEKKKEWTRAVVAFFIQLALNAMWSFIFFGLRNPGAAFIELVVLWLAVLITAILFARISKSAAWLLLPYIIWVSFAGYLNFSIWQLSMSKADQTACTMEAKLCPDGSYVGRTAPDCEFAPCPETAPVLGGDKDEHGCIGSAGYSWCEQKQKCLRVFEEDCFSNEAIKTALAKKYKKAVSEIFIKIRNENKEYAAGRVKFGNEEGEGGIFLAAKISDKWELIFDGNGSINCQDIKRKYQFPPEFLIGFCD